MSARHTAVPASYLILRRGNEILLGRRQGTAYYRGWYDVPSGHVEPGEMPMDAMVREAKEEIGIEIDRADLRLVHTMYRAATDATGDRADYFFTASKWKGEPSIVEPHKCDDQRWFAIDQLPENLMHHITDAILAIERGEMYSEVGVEKGYKSPT